MANNFEGKVAIVTGGASGIGKAVCAELLKAGAKVVVADIDEFRAGQAAEELAEFGKEVYSVRMDVADHDEVRHVIAQVAAEHGHLDYMFNNAAPPWSRDEMLALPMDAWRQAIDVTVYGVLHGTLAAYEIMARQGYGHIINTSSIAGLIGYPTCVHYSATKAAIINLSYSMRFEAAEHGVNVSVVCPGPIHGKTRYWFKLIGVEAAARQILQGVARNKAFIVFPGVARALWLLYRISPNLLFPLGRKLVRGFRKKAAIPYEHAFTEGAGAQTSGSDFRVGRAA